MAGMERKLAVLAVVGLFAAGSASALPIPIEPVSQFESEAVDPGLVSPGMGTSGEGPDMESVLQGMSFVQRDVVVVREALPVQPVTGCGAAGACQATAVPEPGTGLLLIAGLLGLYATQRKNG